jgi:6-phosphogluconolactonase
MTFPAINNSRTILVLVSGASKKKILQKVLEGEPNRYPAQRIQPRDGQLYWLVDEAASSLLKEK